MRISIKSTKNKIFYYGLESVRNGKKVHSKIVKKFGTYDELIKEHEDPESWVRNEILRINNLKKENVESFDKEINYSLPLDSRNDVASKSLSKNIGRFYLKQIFSDLQIKEFFNSVKGKEEYDASALFEFLVASRILNPKSKRGTILEQDKFYGVSGFKLEESYKILPLLSVHDEELQKFLFNKTKQITNFETDVLFYDCTNFYCETKEQDEDVFDLTEENILQYGLRKYGVSKEHRPNPIVQMGLFIDKNGIPLAYDLHPGNTNEQITVKPIEGRLIKQYKASNFIYCADAGLNSSTIKFINSLEGRKYIVSQSIKGIKNDEIDAILSDLNRKIRCLDEKGNPCEQEIKLSEFKNLVIKFANGEELTDDEKNILKHDRIYKKYPMKVTADLHAVNPKTFKKSQEITFDETFYITFSAKEYLYQNGIFSKQLLRAQNIVEHSSSKKENPNSPKRFVKQEQFTSNGELAEDKKLSIDKEKVSNEEKFLGIYCIATNIEDKTIEELLEINKKRWRIELCFKIMKSYLDTRPMYVSTYDAIKGHFSICYTALLTYVLLEKKIKEVDDNLTIDNIISTLKNMNVIQEDEGYFKSIYTDSKTLQALEKIYKKDLNKKFYKTKKLNSCIF